MSSERETPDSLALRFRISEPAQMVLFVCDMQEKFAKSIQDFEAIVEVGRRLVSAARILNIPIIATEQYPKGLGHTVPGLDLLDSTADTSSTGLPAVTIFEKTRFTMLVDEAVAHFEACTNSGDRKDVILFGVEAHVCIYATAIDLLCKGHKVFVVVDACGSRWVTLLIS